MSPRVALLLVAAAAFGGGALLAGPPGEVARPAAPASVSSDFAKPGPARTELENRCLMCHGEPIVASQRLTQEQWKAELAKMEKFGAPLAAGSEEEAAILAHLAATRAPGTPPEPPERAQPPAPPAFASLVAPVADADPARGAERYAAACAACHGKDAQGDKAPRLLARPILGDPAGFGAIVTKGLRGMPASAALDAAAAADILAHLRALTRDAAK